MRAEEYEDLPEGMSLSEVEKTVETFIAESDSDTDDEMYRKVAVICDRQWHTYELPSDSVRRKVREWIVKNWRHDQRYLEVVLGLCYCFGLQKDLFEKALNVYNAEQRWEYVQILENSGGDVVDPYWSMR